MGFFKEVVMELIITCQTSRHLPHCIMYLNIANIIHQCRITTTFFQLIMYFLLVKRTIEHMINSIKTEGNINMVLLNVWQHSLGLTTISLFGVRSKLSKSTKKPGHLIKLQRLYSRQHFVDSYYVIKLQLIINSCFFFSYYVSIIFLLCPQRL